MFHSYTESEHSKIFPLSIHPINPLSLKSSKFLFIISLFIIILQTRKHGLCKNKSIEKKRWTSVQSSQLKERERERERKRDYPWSSLVLQSSSTIYKTEVYLQGAKVELRFHHHYHCPHLPHSPPYSAIPYINHTCTS